MKNIILYGAPGVGKGAQGEILKKTFHFKRISPGDLFREAISAQTELGKKVQKIVESGALVQNEITDQLVAHRIVLLANKRPLLFDGYPRNLDQAEKLIAFAKEYAFKIDFIFNLILPWVIIKERISGRLICQLCKKIFHKVFFPVPKDQRCDFCGSTNITKRTDDNESIMVKRYNSYCQLTEEILGYFKINTNIPIINIDAKPLPRDIFQDIYSYLK